MKQMKWRVIYYGCILLCLVLTACGRKPSISKYQEDFGFSLKNLQTETVQYERLDAFQDPWTAYAVRLVGQIEGSDFDPADMTEGLSDRAESTIQSRRETANLSRLKKANAPAYSFLVKI